MEHIMIIVPEDRCPLDVLAEMGEQTKNAVIFLHRNVIEKLKKTADYIKEVPQYVEYAWKETDKYPRMILDFESKEEEYHRVYRIFATDIAFVMEVKEPDKEITLEMA